MISITTLLIIVGSILVALYFVIVTIKVIALEKKIRVLTAFCVEKMETIASQVSAMKTSQEHEDAEKSEERRRTVAAQKRFTDGVANILNYGMDTLDKGGLKLGD